MDTSLTPLLAMKSRALLTLAILWKRILPLSGLGSLSPRCKRRGQESEVMRGSWRIILKPTPHQHQVPLALCYLLPQLSGWHQVLGSLYTDLYPSPEMTSKSSMSLRPLRKSSSMFSIWVPALRRCELHQAVKVWGQRTVLRP